MKNKKISIITPSFNQGEYIEDAIISVLNQNYDNFEHIIIDGGSTDNTIAILEKYKHIKWISEKDNGQSDAINKGFKMSTGEIIGWLNTDDYYEENIFNTINCSFDLNTDIVYANHYFIDKDKKLIGKKTSNKFDRFTNNFYCFIPSTTFFMKKEILEKKYYIDESFNICMDKEYFAKLSYNGFRFKYLSGNMAYFRLHENNKSKPSKDVNEQCKKESIEIMNRYFYDFSRCSYLLQKVIYKVLFNVARIKRRVIMNYYKNRKEI